jgi:hypothetical protein
MQRHLFLVLVFRLAQHPNARTNQGLRALDAERRIPTILDQYQDWSRPRAKMNGFSPLRQTGEGRAASAKK